MESAFLQWDELKERYGDDTFLVFLMSEGDAEYCVLINDDAVRAATRVHEQGELVVDRQGITWRFNSAYRSFYMRQLEPFGDPIVFCQSADTPLRPTKVRLPSDLLASDPQGRQVDKVTGRILIGRSALGSYWWCPRACIVFMRDLSHNWLGHFCKAEDWSHARGSMLQHDPIPV